MLFCFSRRRRRRRCYLRSYTARLGLTVRRVGPPDTGSTPTGMPARVPMSHGPGWSEDNKVPRYSACTHARSPWEITESGVPRFSTRVASRITLRGAGVHALFIAQPDCGISPPEHTRRGRRVFFRAACGGGRVGARGGYPPSCASSRDAAVARPLGPRTRCTGWSLMRRRTGLEPSAARAEPQRGRRRRHRRATKKVASTEPIMP